MAGADAAQPLLITALAAASACAACALLLAGLHVQLRKAVHGLADLPKGLRLPLRLTSGLVTTEIMPRAVALRLEGLLRRAGLSAPYRATDWIVAQAVWCLIVIALTAPIAGATVAIAVPLIGSLLAQSWLRDRIREREREMLRELPVYLDLLRLSLEAGTNVTTALRIIVHKAPRSVLRDGFAEYLLNIRAGMAKADALEQLARFCRTDAVQALVGAMQNASSSGAALGAALRAQAEQRRQERYNAAEQLAAQAPLKMLLPLVLCIFPCVFLIIGFPIVVRITGAG
ncbi:MAG: type II secretion system F family protein [Steroidobacteraceae bacterium]